MFPSSGHDRQSDQHGIDRARARLWFDAACEALARGAARLPDSLPLRSLHRLAESFGEEIGRRA